MLKVSEAEWKLRVDLAASFHLAVKYDLHEGITNHFSAVLPDGKHFLINPFGLHFSEITASKLIVCNFAGKVIRGKGTPSPAAHHIHTAIHRLIPRAKVIFHTHQPYATALTMIENGRLEWSLQTACRFYNRVAYDVHYEGLVLSESVGERIAKTLGDADILFLGNHGVITVASTIAQAFDDLYFLERVAQTQIIALSSGHKLIPLATEIVEKVAAQTDYQRVKKGHAELHFNAQKRLLTVDYSQ